MLRYKVEYRPESVLLARDLLTAEDVTNGTGSTEATESTENSGQTLVEEVLTDTSEGTLDFIVESAEDGTNVD